MSLLGVVVLAIAIFALRQPSDRRVVTAGNHTTTSTSRPASAPASTSPTSRPPTPTSSSSARSAAGSSTGAASSAASGSVAGARLPLVVLNNTTVSGLAQQAEAAFVAGGWTVSSVGNLQNEIISTCAYYDPSIAGAQAAATALRQQFSQIKRTAVKFSGLPAGAVVVVLTPDYVSGG